DRLAFPVHPAFLRRNQAHKAFEQRGLANAVTPEQAGDFSNPGLERQAAKDVAAAVVLMEFFDLEHGSIPVFGLQASGSKLQAKSAVACGLWPEACSRGASAPQINFDHPLIVLH